MKKTVALLITMLLPATSLFTACGWDDADRYVKLGNYTGLEIAAEDTEVTDDELEYAILEDRYSLAVTNEITDRPARQDDTVKVVYSLSVDGNIIDGNGEKYVLTIGEGACPFEEDIIGHNTGDVFTVTKTIDDEELKDYLGLMGKYTIELTDILQIDVPDEDEAFAANMGFNSLEEYTKAKKETLSVDKKKKVREKQYDELLSVIAADSFFRDYPEDSITQKEEELKASYEAEAKKYGLVPDKYTATMLGVDVEDIEDALYLAAVALVEKDLIVKAVAEKEKITVDDEQYEAEVIRILNTAGVEDRETFKEKTGKEFEDVSDKEAIKNDLLREKVCEFIYDNAVFRTE